FALPGSRFAPSRRGRGWFRVEPFSPLNSQFVKKEAGVRSNTVEPYPGKLNSIRKDKNLGGFISGGHRGSNGTIVLQTASGSSIALLPGAKSISLLRRKYSERKL